MPEMTETQTPGRKPKKKKNKESHNAVERHRKEKINAGINRIGDLLPCSQALKQSKNMILDQAFHYIAELKKQNDTMLLEGGDKVQAEEIRRLRRQLEELRRESGHYIELLKAHDINILEDPTIHWKGKQRCAKVAKVTPTHQLPKGIIVYTNGNALCPAGQETSPGKKSSETLILRPSSEVSTSLRVNGAVLQVNSSSSTPALLPGSAATPTQSTPALRVIEQCLVETPAAAPTLPPSASYITLQIPSATTALTQVTQPAASAQTLSVAATSSTQLPIVNPTQPVSTLTQTIPTLKAAATGEGSWATQETAMRTLSYTTIPNSQALLRAGAAGSTQTTWTTLQMAGNTVQPVCQSVPTPEVINTSQAVQQLTVCPLGNKPSVQPIQIQMQPHVPVQQAPITAHIQAQPFQSPPQLRPAILNHAKPQPVIAPQPQCTVLPQPAVVTQPQPAVLQPASLVPHPTTALIPQPQPALVPQPQATVLPLLQTMQVLQVNPTGATASCATAPQNTNNPSVVILQQASACPTQSVVREEITNQTPCQHIVIIQAPNQVTPAAQNPQVGVVSAAVPGMPAQIPSTSSTTSSSSLQSVGGKQLVHILPRPIQPQMTQPLQVTQASSSPPVPQTPQTITVNGQVFALQPMKTSDKPNSQGVQSTLQLVQPTTTEEPTTNVALNSLGALSSLNQSISQGLPITISTQNNSQLPAAPSSVVQQKQPPAPASIPGATLALPARQLQVPRLDQVKPGLVVKASKPAVKRLRSNASAKCTTAKRTKATKKKELSQVQPTVSVSAETESQTVQVSTTQVLQTVKVTNFPSTPTIDVTNTEQIESVTSTQNSQIMIICSSSNEINTSVQSNPQGRNSASETNNSGATPVATTVDATSVSAAVATESKPAVACGSSSAPTKLSAPEVTQPVTSSAASSTQSKSAVTPAVSRQNRSVVSSATDTQNTSTAVSTVCPTSIGTSSPPTTHVSSHQASSVFSPQGLNTQAPLSCTRSEPQKTTSPLVATTVAIASPTVTFSGARSSVTAPTTSSELRKRVTTSQQTDVPNPPSCQPTEVKAAQTHRREREAQEARQNQATEKESIVAVTASRKDLNLSQQVYTNLDDQTMEHPITSSRQTDSPMSTVAGGGRGFSVASMLPQGHSISASSGSFGTYTFTSEQAEMLALAMLEQDSPSRRSGDGTSSANPSTATWEPPKTPPVSSSKERNSGSQQGKVTKPMDTVSVKPVAQVSVSGPTGNRHQQNISYSQSQPLSQVQSQSGTVASLSVNNLIRPSSIQQPFPGSPSLGQQGSAPSPAVPSAHISQPSNNAQLNEYTPLKTALMRAQAGVSVGERQVKIISKRQAQEEVMLNTGKRPKPCPPSAPAVSHMDVKAADHNQMMVGQLPPTSSSVMTRINPESGGPLFSTNSFMSPVVRPTDGHCTSQAPPEQTQPGVLHLPQGHPQHAAAQPGQHLGGNLYMKQQQEQQRHHLYHLQHHLTQPDPAQRHSLHQRALQQQQQEQQQQQQQHQHVQKKRGLVRGSQTASPAGLQQKQHHLEKSGVQQQQQHAHQQQQTQHQQHTQQQHQQQSHQQSQQHQQPAQHQQSHPQQHQQQTHPQQTQTQHQQHQQQQQLQQQQSSHSRHQQHLQQQIQQQQQHFRHQEKSCEAQAAGSRGHHSSHLAQQEHLKSGQDHNTMQRMMSSRTLEQQLISPPSNPVSRSSDLSCAPSRQERHRVSNYSAEALIGKSSTSGEQQQRMALHLQPGRSATQEQQDLRGYLDTSRGKASIAHNPQNRLPPEHPGSADVQRVSECPPFKAMGGGTHQLGGFEAQVSRGSDMAPKSVPSSQRGPQGQQQGGFRMGVGPTGDARTRSGYSATHPGTQGVQVGPTLPREQEGCHQSFMSLLSPHLPEQSNHQRAVQCCPPVGMDYSCVPGSSSGDIQAKTSSPSVPPTQKAPAMRLGEGNKGHISQVSSNMHGGPGVRTGLPHPATPHSSAEPGRSSAPSRPPPAVSQHSRHIARDTQPTKLRPGDRPRSGALRQSNPFEPEGHLPLPSGGGVLLSRPQSGGEARRSTIVRFMADSTQVPNDNNLVPDQHLTQNFGFPFIPEGGMNPPPINANSTFIPPVSQPNASRTPSLLPVEPQNTLPSFYPSYSPAAHPSLSSDVTLQYFPNQMFTSPSADKGSAPPLNNRFGSILSPPRPVGFGQASFPLLTDMPPMPIANSSGITPHISNFSLTSLFPEIATGMPTDGSAMPMSPLLSLSNTSSADSSKQPNRPAHNISHILGHDGSSAV